MQGGRYAKSEKKKKKKYIERKTRKDSIVTDVQMGIWDWHKLNSKTNKGSGDEFPE